MYALSAQGRGGMSSTEIRCWRFAVRSITAPLTGYLNVINSVCKKRKNHRMLLLRNRGFEVGKGSVSVKAELQKFYNDFKTGFFSGDAVAEVVINVQVQKSDGSVRFVKVVSGEGKEPNIQLSSGTNAKAALERALSDAISKLFNDQ